MVRGINTESGGKPKMWGVSRTLLFEHLVGQVIRIGVSEVKDHSQDDDEDSNIAIKGIHI